MIVFSRRCLTRHRQFSIDAFCASFDAISLIRNGGGSVLSWVCDTCSCNNDDDVLECFVCGSHRSKASIREAARRRREKKMNALADMLYSKVFRSIKIGTVVVGALFIIAFVIRIVQGNLFADLETNIGAITSTVSFQARSFVSRWSSFDILGKWLPKVGIIVLFVQYLDIPISLKEAGASMVDLACSNIHHITANFFCMLPSATKFDEFLVINNKMAERGSCLESYCQYSLDTINHKFLGIKDVARCIVDTARLNIERILLIIDSGVHSGTVSVQNCGNYINRVISKFRK